MSFDVRLPIETEAQIVQYIHDLVVHFSLNHDMTPPFIGNIIVAALGRLIAHHNGTFTAEKLHELSQLYKTCLELNYQNERYAIEHNGANDEALLSFLNSQVEGNA